MEYKDKVLEIAEEINLSTDSQERFELNEKLISEAIARREALSAQSDLAKKDKMIEQLRKSNEDLMAKLEALTAQFERLKAGNEPESEED